MSDIKKPFDENKMYEFDNGTYSLSGKVLNEMMEDLNSDEAKKVRLRMKEYFDSFQKKVK